MRLNHTLILHIARQTGGPTLGKTRCVKNYTLWLERKKKRKNGRGVGKIRKNKFITNNNRNRFIFSNLQASLARTCFEKNDITLCRWLWFCGKFTTDRQYVWENGLEWVGLFFSDTPSNSPPTVTHSKNQQLDTLRPTRATGAYFSGKISIIYSK